MNAQVRKELEAIPRGSPDQDMYRMAYEQARLNGLSSRHEIPNQQRAARHFALHMVWEHHRDFTPERR